MLFRLPFLPRRGVAALLSCTVCVGASLLSISTAGAQVYTWGGTGSATTTTDYNLDTNWSTPPAGAPPVAAGQSAILDTTGSATVSVSAVIAPDSWTFNANSNAQSYSISGSDVNFSLAGASGGVINYANAGQTISISNNIGESLSGVRVQQFGASTLILAGTNTYTGGTEILAGTVQVRNNSSVGTGAVTMNGGTFQADGSSNLTFTNGFTVDNRGGTVDNNGVVLTLSGAITDGFGGGGLLRFTDSSFSGGTTVLSGTNSYTGGTLISGGSVQVTNNSSVGTGAVTLDGGTFQADGFSSLTFTNDFKLNTTGGTVDNNGTLLELAGTISNGNGATGVLQITDSSGGFGITLLSGTNTYSGGTKVVGATLQVSNDNAVGTGLVTLENGLFMAADNVPAGSLTFANNFAINNTGAGSAIDVNGWSLTITGNIVDGNGPGKLTVLDSFGGGVLVLLGTNTYSGGTFICNCGSLQLGDATHMASLVGAVVNDGVFNIVNANTSGISSITTEGPFAQTSFFGNNTAGTATLTNKNGGITAFFDSSTAGSANVINRTGGTTLFGTPFGTDTSTAGSATFDNNNGGVVFAAHTNAGTATFTNHNGGGVIFGDNSSGASATFINNNGGFTSFGQPFGTDTPTAGNANITNNSGGETDFNAFATAGTATITTNSGGSLFFFDNSTGGKAQLITVGAGYVDFSGSLGPNGDGRIPVGSIAGSGTYYIGAGNTLVAGGNNLSTMMSGVIADFNPAPGCGCPPIPGIGNFEKAGTGTLILSGTNTYTGTTAVNGGVLQVDGSIASSIMTTVNAGGALTGIGTVGNTTIASGGIVVPGSGAPGTFMTVSGSLAFQSGGLYLVQLNATTSSFANVTGTAALSGLVGASFAPGSSVMKQYGILTAAGGVSGAFDGVATSGVPGGLVATLSYDPTHAYLNFALDFGAKSNLNVNQQNVGNALNNFFNANGGIPFAFASLTPGGLTRSLRRDRDRIAAGYLRCDEPVFGVADRSLHCRTQRRTRR